MSRVRPQRPQSQFPTPHRIIGQVPIRALSVAAALTAVLATGESSVHAGVNYKWIGNTTVNADFSTATNWSPTGVPGASDGFGIATGSSATAPVVFNPGVGNTVSLYGGINLGGPQPGGSGGSTADTGYLAINSGTMQQTSQATYIGYYGTGVMTINSGGTFSKSGGSAFTEGLNTGSNGTIVVNTGGTLALQVGASIGSSGDGVLKIYGGTLQDTATANTQIWSVGTGAGTGLIDIRGGTISSTSTGVLALNVGYISSTSGTGRGTLEGYGTVNTLNTSGTGKFGVGGQIIADGTQANSSVADHTLNISYQAGQLLTSANTPGTTHYGWYTANHGALELPAVTIGSNSNNKNYKYAIWGDPSTVGANWTPGTASTALVNSAALHTNVTSGTVNMALLDPTRTTAVDGSTALLANNTDKSFLNIWQVTPSVALNADQFSVRYDESFSPTNAADTKAGSLYGFYYWDGNPLHTWQDLSANTTIDTTNYLAQFSDSGSPLSFSAGTSGYFALAAVVPEPASLALLVLGSGLILLPRKKHQPFRR